jgi:DNA polymerase-1
MSSEKRKLIIIDGHAMAFRAHYALISGNLTNSKNEPVETVFGFYRMISKLLRELKPDYFTFVFDPKGGSFRSTIYPEYKANRKETPAELVYQFSEVIEIAQKLKIPVLTMEGFEADDVIASLTKKFKSDDIDIIIVSGDKDLFGILNDHTSLYRPVKGVSEFKIFSNTDIFNEVGVLPEQIVDYMALTGDTSDNVPGVAGIGPKTASKLVSEYGNLDKIYENLETIKPDGLRKKLTLNKDNAFLSRELVTLKSDLEITQNLGDFLWKPEERIKDEISIFRDKELPALYDEWKQMLPEGSFTEAESSTGINKNIYTIRTLSEWNEIAGEISASEIIALDTETTSVSTMEAKLVGVSFGWKINNSYKSAYIPVVFDDVHERHFDYQDIPEGVETLQWVKPVIENEKIKKVGQNIKYDYLVLLNHGVTIKSIYADTMVLSYMIDPNQRKHNMDDLAWRHLQHETVKYKDLAGTGKKTKALMELPLEELSYYAAEDAEVTFRLYEILIQRLRDENLEDLYRKIDGPMIGLLAEMEKNGILIDTAYMKSLEKSYTQKIHLIEDEIYELAGEKFNINSTRELQTILFDKLQIASKKKTPKGSLSTDAAVLEMLKDQHPIVEKILEYRLLAKLLNTYISALPEYINPKTGRIHTSFSQTIAATGRLASFDPNLQNIPVKENEGKAIRKAFICPNGYSLLSLDYSQIELRILAHYSEDPNLIEAFKNNVDIHDQAAYLLFHNMFDPSTGKWDKPSSLDLSNTSGPDMSILNKMKATPEFSSMRSQAKILNFSIVYGVTEYGLSKNLSISVEEARNLIAMYFINYPGIKNYMAGMVELARETSYSTNLFGRKRKIEDIQSKNRFSREAAERLAINNPIQSTAADLLKVAMLRIQNAIESKNLKTRLLLQIHDELLLEVPESEKETAFDLVKNEMENVISLKVPLTVSGGYGKNWGDLK